MKNVLNTATVAAVLALAAVGAQAQVQSAEAGYGTDVLNAQSTLSRQQVTNAFLTARNNGSLALAGGDSYTDPLAGARGSAVARSDVQRQASNAAQGGNALVGEGSVQ